MKFQRRTIGWLAAGFVCVCALGLSLATPAHATLVITFTNNGFFDGDGVGATAPTAPANFTDPASLHTGRITTTSVLPTGTPAVLNEVSMGGGKLGIDSTIAGDSADEFDPGESWSFSWNTTTQFAGISFADYATSGGGQAADEEFRVSSTDWIGRLITPGSVDVVFDMATGTFIFDNDDPDDTFTAADLGGVISLAANAVVTIAIFDTNLTGGDDDGSASIASMSFNIVVVPEPSAFLFGGAVSGVLGCAVFARRWAGGHSRTDVAAK